MRYAGPWLRMSVLHAGRRAAGAGAADPVAIREWAKSQGIEVKDRGRVPAGLLVKFKAATVQ
jgi:Lsr2